MRTTYQNRLNLLVCILLLFVFVPPITVTAASPANTSQNLLKYLVQSGIEYLGESSNGSTPTKFRILFSDYVSKTGQFKGKLTWVGYNVVDALAGKLTGSQLVFKQISRLQNNTTTKMDCTITMTIQSYTRASGTWSDAQNNTKGTLWFTFPPHMTTDAKYKGAVDSNGLPTGTATVDFGDRNKFVGEVQVVNQTFIATGVVTYHNGTMAIGRFINGKPDGLCSIIYPNKKAYLIDFTQGKPIQYYIAQTIPVYKANEIDVYKAASIEVYQADTIEPYQSKSIEVYHAKTVEPYQSKTIEVYNAKTIEPYKAKIIDLYQAKPIEKYTSTVTIDKYQAKIVQLNPPGAFNVDIPIGGYSTPDYTNPLVQAWTAHMMALPYLLNGNMGYSY